MEVQTTKLVISQGLAKLMEDANLDVVEIYNIGFNPPHVSCHLRDDAWYKYILYYFENMNCPPILNEKQQNTLKLASQIYELIKVELMWRNHDRILLKCLD